MHYSDLDFFFIFKIQHATEAFRNMPNSFWTITLMAKGVLHFFCFRVVLFCLVFFFSVLTCGPFTPSFVYFFCCTMLLFVLMFSNLSAYCECFVIYRLLLLTIDHLKALGIESLGYRLEVLVRICHLYVIDMKNLRLPNCLRNIFKWIDK